MTSTLVTRGHVCTLGQVLWSLMTRKLLEDTRDMTGPTGIQSFVSLKRKVTKSLLSGLGPCGPGQPPLSDGQNG